MPLLKERYNPKSDDARITVTVHGKFPETPDLNKLAGISRELFPRVMLMEKLNVLVIIAPAATIHIHGNGELAVNGVRSLGEAERLLTQLTDGRR